MRFASETTMYVMIYWTAPHNIYHTSSYKQATSGLAGLQKEDHVMSYDDLVKAKGILDLIVELPSFEAELGEGFHKDWQQNLP